MPDAKDSNAAMECSLTEFLTWITQGKRSKIDAILKKNVAFLSQSGNTIDYSGRIFKNITAYEYAYWAKDTHTCRMLESHMDAPTKAAMLIRCDAIEANGLPYEQAGHVIEHSTHFDFKPLINALQFYVDNYQSWVIAENWADSKAFWIAVGLAQRDMPVHVAQEYFRHDRSFDPVPSFDEEMLPEDVTFFNYHTKENDTLYPLFPLVMSDASGLGVNFALIRAWLPSANMERRGSGSRWLPERTIEPLARIDLAAIRRLDEVRTLDLVQLRENLRENKSARILKS